MIKNELKVFNYQSSEVRTVEVDGEPWFVLKDVCAILNIENHKDVVKRLDADEVGRFNLPHPQNPDKLIEMVCINESGLYNVLLRSDKPEAKPLRKWVTSEVLPSIRKTGSYNAVPITDYDRMVANTAAENARTLYQTRRQKAQSAAEALQSRRALEARALLLEQTLAAVDEQLNALSGEEYFTALQGLLKKCRTGQPGEVLLNERDCNALAERLLAPYPELKAVPASLKNGFILRYGKVEQNCTFAALLREKRDELKDSLAAMLFA